MARPLFELDPVLDPAYLAAHYRASRRLHIPGLLKPDAAKRLFLHLHNSADWKLIFTQGEQGEKLWELSREEQAALTAEEKANLEQEIYKRARDGFQFKYEYIFASDGRRKPAVGARLLDEFASFMSSEPMLEFLRRVTGFRDITYADAQATAYGPGHFLTAHDDDVAGKNRRAAYVFNLTPSWKVDWGGLLMFHGTDGHVDESYAPAFNALNIFGVPQLHSVSMVAPFAPHRRYSVTGWLRTGEPPA
jgi:Rps23 Pro-64 3,4-dihydroxylase Tpa1-like proline 4-hydroxylase